VLVLAVSVLLTACGDDAPSASPSPLPVAGVASFQLSSPVAADGGTLPAEFTCDGAGVSPPLRWTSPPAGTREFALMMTTLPGDGTTKWNWVLSGVPATIASLDRASTDVGTPGIGSDGPLPGYQPPCSQGPGAKTYTFTVYALSSAPSLPPGRVTGAALTSAIAPVTLSSATLSLTYTRPSSPR
jgi:phosphatidylethanolamine-binding protein (PEBP) family uncharacterized protein